MSDVLAIVVILLLMGLGFPALLFTVALAFPAAVERARLRVEHTPLRCVWMGVLIALLLVLPISALFAIPGAGQFVASVLILVSLTLATIGGAGMAARLGERMHGANQDKALSPRGLLVGATALELAVVFPIIGWLIVLPVALLIGLGATTFSLLHWQPRRVGMVTVQVPQPAL